jgi:hypothetical protein
MYDLVIDVWTESVNFLNWILVLDVRKDLSCQG